ncbi:tetratricopeptide repeat protein [Thermobifida halotolerans]|uniref:Tetratricopeptide repeat protein n=2 Tax=Thermobifida halotolerans TaxID=483545 RepID=A0AA97LWU6_9ACTN|nr:FxSxx-COOH system tetratricopeptide repeat protein [Thermobifida halotolerans]UOE19490.1 tetratricopeptide repeat protein [Thermobifida halotolerans]
MSDPRHAPEPDRAARRPRSGPTRGSGDTPPPVAGWELADAVYLAAWREARSPGGVHPADTAPTAPVPAERPPESASADPGRPGTAFPALPDRQGLVRALRPFHLRLPDPHWPRFDPETTARDHAQNLLTAAETPGTRGHGPVPLVPRSTPDTRPGVRLTVLADESVSMLFQQQVVKDLVGLLRSSGAFRSVRLRRFESDTATPARVVVHGPDDDTAPDQGALRVAVVLSDGVGQGWATGSVQSWLGGLARRLPVGVVHLLAPRQWRRTGIRPEPMEVTASAASRAPANRHYSARPFQWPEELPLPETGAAPPESSLVLPVLPLRAEAIRTWAEFVMGRRAGRTLNVSALRVVPDDAAANAVAPERGTGTDTPVEAVRRFHHNSSAAAFQLAVDLAAVPLTGPAIDTVCRWGSGRSPVPELTEILFSGLVRAVDSATATPARRIEWEYRTGIRRTLLSLGGRRSRIRSVLALLASSFADADPWFRVLGQILVGDDVRLPELDETSLRLADDTLPALECIGLTSGYRELVRSVSGRTLPGGEVVYQGRHSVHLDRAYGAEATARRPGVAVGGRSGEAARAPHLSNTSPTPTAESTTTSQGAASMPGNPSDSTGSRRTRRFGSAATAWGSIPPRNPMFTGRGELLTSLRGQLVANSEQGRMVPSVLNGMPGIGKTQLATEYLYRYSEDYDLIWWVRANQANQIHEAYALLAQELGVFQPGSSISSMVHTVREALRRGEPYARWLLVFDDAQKPEDVAPYLPVGGDGHIVITSRNMVWAARGYHATLTVDVFSRQESIDLLRKCGPEDLTDSEADELADVLDDLPIALRQAAAWMNETATPASEYLAQFREKRSEVLPTLSPADPDYPVTVVTAWNVSLDKLATTNPAALQLLQVCSFFSTAPIPRYLFAYARDIPAPPALSEALGNPTKLGRAFGEISRYGLAQINHRTHTLQLHLLVQRALRFSLSEEERRYLRHCAHMLLAKSDPHDTSPEARSRYAQLLPHIWASEAWECDDPWVRELVIQQIYVTDLRGEYDDARKLAKTALAAWRTRLGATAPETLRAELRLVRVLRNLGEHRRAYELCERVLNILTERHGPDAGETLEASNEFIRDLRFAGRFRESTELARTVYDKYRRLLGPDDPETLEATHRYAYALLLSGDHRRAAELFWEAYQNKEMILGPNEPTTLASVDGYADALIEAGDYTEALRLQRENTERVRELFGLRHQGTLSNMGSLSAMLRRAGHLDEAVSLSETVWREASNRFGAESRVALYAASNYATSLRTVNRYREALELAEEACRRYADLLGEDHPHVAAANVNRAVTLRVLGRAAEARAIDEQALRVLTERLGEEHTSTLACAVNLASDLFALGDVSGALRRDSEVLERCRGMLTDRHPLTLLARRNLVLDRRGAGEDVAEELAVVEQLYVEIMGDQHPATLSVRQGIRGNADVYLGPL